MSMSAEVSSTRLYLGNLPRDGTHKQIPSSHLSSTRFLPDLDPHNTGWIFLALSLVQYLTTSPLAMKGSVTGVAHTYWHSQHL